MEVSSGSPSLSIWLSAITQLIWTGFGLILHTEQEAEKLCLAGVKIQGYLQKSATTVNMTNDELINIWIFFSFSLRSLHLQFHGSSAHLRLPGRPLQQKGHPELWHFLLVHCNSVELLHQQRGKRPTPHHTHKIEKTGSTAENTWHEHCCYFIRLLWWCLHWQANYSVFWCGYAWW